MDQRSLTVTHFAFSRIQMDSMTVITSSGGLVNTRNSEMSDLSKESSAWGREKPSVTLISSKPVSFFLKHQTNITHTVESVDTTSDGKKIWDKGF